MPLRERVTLIVIAVAGAVFMYHCVENPIRRAHFLTSRPRLCLLIIPLSVAAVLGTAAFELHRWAVTEPLIRQLI
jgi:peptidoglycan/LPS O-acetylase OafA/YrhL